MSDMEIGFSIDDGNGNMRAMGVLAGFFWKIHHGKALVLGLLSVLFFSFLLF